MKTLVLFLAALSLLITFTSAGVTSETRKPSPIAEQPSFEPGYRLTFTNPQIGLWSYTYTGT
jgi:hypothetical protein